jgi:putative endonuclease
MKPWWVYIARCRDGSLYTGISDDVGARIGVHNAGKGARYTRGRGPVKLVYEEKCGDKSGALKREYEIKKLDKAGKEKLVVE